MTAQWSEILLSADAAGGADRALVADALILDVIRPVWTPGTAAFVLREPERSGPAVRYRVLAAPLETEHIAARLEEAARGTDRAVDVRLMPRGSETFDLAEIFGGPGADPAIAGLLAELTGPVFDLLASLRSGELSRLETGFDLMIAAMVVINSDVFGADRERDHPVAFICYRSSADGFLLMCRDPAGARERFDAAYRAGGTGFRERLRAVLSQLQDAGPVVSAPAAALAQVLAPRVPQLRQLIESGQIAALTKPSGYIGDEFDLGPSAFHQIIQGSPRFQQFMRTDSRFHTMRVCLSLLCAVLHQLGIRVIDRYVLSHCLACAAEDVFGVSSADVLSGLRVMRTTM